MMDWVKKRYRRSLFSPIFDSINIGRSAIYNVNIVNAMRWTVMEWEAYPEETMKNCYFYCFKNEFVHIAEAEESGGADKIGAQMERNMMDHGTTLKRARIVTLLSPDNEDDEGGSVSFDKLGGAAAVVEDVVSEEPEQDKSSETDCLFNGNEKLKSLAVAHAILACFGLLNEDLLSKHCICKLELRAQIVADLKQITQMDNFKTSRK